MISLKEMNPILLILIGWNAITFLLMGLDKFFAKRQKRRIKESTLRVAAHKTGFTKQELWQLPCKGC